ncbi:regulatory protein GemA [Ancylobacter sp. G4_0304]|uniref:regulatory protein GemA n=1 Tax=Ancylobacter sp. G4_0304 TaxID=3114289 RepID=UPI0039C6595F
MSYAPISKQQIGAIHAEKSRAALDDETYRDILRRETGRASSKQLNSAEAGRVLDYLRALPGRSDRPLKEPSKKVRGAVRISGAYAGKLRALWLTGYNLGVIDDRTDRALLDFIERQTGISHPDWWTEAAQANRAIEALKAWIEREAGVDWRDCRSTLDHQRAAYHALRRRLVALGVRNHMPEDVSRFQSVQFIEWMRLCGAQLRKALKARAAA